MAVALVVSAEPAVRAATPDEEFNALSERYLVEFAKFTPVAATLQGDHRFDGHLDVISDGARAARLAWLDEMLASAEDIEPAELERSNQVDLALLKHQLRSDRWALRVLQEWAWNPLVYTGLCGDSLYGLVARDFAPLPERLRHATQRMLQLPRLLKQVRASLQPHRVPAIHAKTAAAQNRGVVSIIRNMIEPCLSELDSSEQVRLRNAIDVATNAIDEHQTWLDQHLVPAAKASYRLAPQLFHKKLAFTLHSEMSAQEIRDAAEARMKELHRMMFKLAVPINQRAGRKVAHPPSAAHQRDVIQFALEQAYREAPMAKNLVADVKESVDVATRFLEERELISLMPDPLEIILMPEFRRGVSVAYCDSPGPLDVGQPTFYVVSPIPTNWTDEQAASFLREYNTRSLHVLTIHEAMPGHFLQIAHANRFQGRLRHLFQSGVFIEGWACYSEWMMCEEGFLEGDPLMRLITLKWYLRDAMNAILDSAVHLDGMTREEAMRRMTQEAFQQEREAAGKWKRAQLTSTQLSSYFVGYLQHVAMRRAVERRWGTEFDLKRYHDRALSFGAPPVRFVQALLLDESIPE